VFPRLGAYSKKEHLDMPLLASGIENFDKILGGGLEKGTTALVVGPAGSGKSTLSAAFVAAAARKGEHAAVFLFDERPETFRKRTSAVGLDLQQFVESGLVIIEQLDPSEIAPGEFGQRVRQMVEEHKTKVLVVDSVSGYFNAVGRSDLFMAQLHELLTFASRCGVLTIMPAAQEGFMSIGQSQGVDISYLSEAIVGLNFYERDGSLHRCVAAVKKRQGPHEMTIRELFIEPGSVRVGEPLTELQHLFVGQDNQHSKGPAESDEHDGEHD
jgi:circadian clock protein KaiC